MEPTTTGPNRPSLAESMGARFTPIDYVMFIAMLLISVLIGVFHACSGGRQRTADEFLMGDRQMGRIPVVMSVIASYISAASMLDYPAEVYRFGSMSVMSYLGLILGMPCAVYVQLPVFYRLGSTSVFEYLELRFDKLTRSIRSFFYILQMTMYVAIVIYTPSMALAQVSGFGFWPSVLCMSVVYIFYTSVGGLKAVVWTDAFQMVVMVGVVAAVVICGVVSVGGLADVFRISYEGQRLELFEFNPDPTLRMSTWSVIFGDAISNGLSIGCDQTTVQRFLSLGSLESAQKSTWYTVIGALAFQLTSAFIGLVLYAKYSQCDPLSVGVIETIDQLVPMFVIDTFHTIPGMSGFFVAGVMSGSLSTISSIVNSMAAVTLEDFVKVYYDPCISQEKAANVSKVLAIFYGIFCVGVLALFDRHSNATENTAEIVGAVAGPMCGIFSLGLFFPQANKIGGLVGLVTATTISVWIALGNRLSEFEWPMLPVSTAQCFANQSIVTTTPSPVTEADVFWPYRISFYWYGALGIATVVLVGLPVSAVTNYFMERERVHKRLLCMAVVDFFVKMRLVSPDWIRSDEPKETASQMASLSTKQKRLSLQPT